jgi:hypothetical protein
VLYVFVAPIVGFDSDAGRLGTVGSVEAISVTAAAVVGKVGVGVVVVDAATAPRSQGFGGEPILALAVVVVTFVDQ